jgi:hypothetical protein
MDRCGVIAPPAVCGRRPHTDGPHITSVPSWRDGERPLLARMADTLRQMHGHQCPADCAIRALLAEYDALVRA